MSFHIIYQTLGKNIIRDYYYIIIRDYYYYLFRKYTFCFAVNFFLRLHFALFSFFFSMWDS